MVYTLPKPRKSGVPGPPLLSSTLETNTAGQTQITPSSSPAPQSVRQSPAFPNYSASLLQATASPNPTGPAGFTSPLAQPPTQQNNGNSASNDDDDWAFTSALPPDQPPPPPSRGELVILNSNLQILLDVNRPTTMPDGPILLRAKFSNNASQPIQDLTFQMAVTKVSLYNFSEFYIIISRSACGIADTWGSTRH